MRKRQKGETWMVVVWCVVILIIYTLQNGYKQNRADKLITNSLLSHSWTYYPLSLSLSHTQLDVLLSLPKTRS
jgi:hypothetical protein